MLRRLALAAVAALVLGAAESAQAQTNLDFELVNKTGYGISEVYVSPSAADKWGETIISEVLENNEFVKISFNPEATGIEKWDLMVTFVDDDSKVYWRGFTLSTINRITLKYNRETQETTSVTE